MEGFDEVVMDFWSHPVRASKDANPWIRFKKKLHHLKSNLRVCNSYARTQMFGKRSEIQENIESLDQRLMENDG